MAIRKSGPRGTAKAVINLQRQRERRARKVSNILCSLPDLDTLESSQDKNQFPVLRLHTSISEFVQGFFESRLLDSAFAAECALLLNLNEKLSQEEKLQIAAKRGGLGLTEAISRSRGIWIDEDLAIDLLDLNNLRNMSAHPSNWLTLVKQIDIMFGDTKTIEKWISKATNQSPRQIKDRFKDKLNKENGKRTAEMLTSYTDSKIGNLPDLEWATHKDTLKFQLDMVKNYSKKLIREMVIDEKIISLANNLEFAVLRLLRKYPFPEDNALKSITIAFNTLNQLKFLPALCARSTLF